MKEIYTIKNWIVEWLIKWVKYLNSEFVTTYHIWTVMISRAYIIQKVFTADMSSRKIMQDFKFGSKAIYKEMYSSFPFLGHWLARGEKSVAPNCKSFSQSVMEAMPWEIVTKFFLYFFYSSITNIWDGLTPADFRSWNFSTECSTCRLRLETRIATPSIAITINISKWQIMQLPKGIQIPTRLDWYCTVNN